jgi:hypothetical protein
VKVRASRKGVKRALWPDIRRDYGVIVTAIVDGETHARVGYGLAVDALEDALMLLERLGKIDRILCISTPETIYRDIQPHPRRSKPHGRPNQGVQLPEPQMLARIGRSDLEPEPSTPYHQKKRIERIRREERRRSQ